MFSAAGMMRVETLFLIMSLLQQRAWCGGRAIRTAEKYAPELVSEPANGQQGETEGAITIAHFGVSSKHHISQSEAKGNKGMHAFYLDEPLRKEEEFAVLRQLKAHGNEISGGIRYHKMPHIIDVSASNEHLPQEIEAMERYLAGTGALDIDTAVIFIMPKENIRWALRVQMSLVQASQAAVFTVQPWGSDTDGEITRREHAHVVRIA